jgi:hypothetical protein
MPERKCPVATPGAAFFVDLPVGVCEFPASHLLGQTHCAVQRQSGKMIHTGLANPRSVVRDFASVPMPPGRRAGCSDLQSISFY